MRKYGISIERYDEMVAAQCGKCLICNLVPNSHRLAVDHCHVTGNVRGLLCSQCNAGLGLLRDDPERLRAALRYLEDHK